MRTAPIHIWRKWLNEDAVYIITDDERTEFTKLTTDRQRDEFVENFWAQRNPDPTSQRNAFKEEHYRRLAYTNEHFAEDIPGWKSDRGRIYILYGPPDSVDQHFSAAGSRKSTDLANATGPIPYDSERWHYRLVKGIGENITFEFVDTCGCGRFRMPVTKEDLNKYKPK